MRNFLLIILTFVINCSIAVANDDTVIIAVSDTCEIELADTLPSKAKRKDKRIKKEKDSNAEKSNKFSSMFSFLNKKSKKELLQDSLQLERASRASLEDSLLILKQKYNDVNIQLEKERKEKKWLRGEFEKNSIAEKNKTTEVYQDKIAQVDMLILRLANARLKEKYNEKFNKEILDYFNTLATDSIKEIVFSENLIELTKRYKSDYNEIFRIIKEAQKDGTRTDKFAAGYAEKYKSKLKQTRYYREIYQKNWKIIYLDNLLNELFDRLKNHDYSNGVYADFSDLIKELEL